MRLNPFSINARENVKRYINQKKVEKYSERGQNTFGILIVDILIIVMFIFTFYYIYFVNDIDILKYLGYGVIAISIAFSIVRVLTIVFSNQCEIGGLTKLIMLDDNGKSLKTWNINNRISLLIGKNTKYGEVDIDLSTTEYYELVSRQHAVLNYAEGVWYIEDLESRNGSGIQRMNENERFKLESSKVYKINSGDIIYIANTKILVK